MSYHENFHVNEVIRDTVCEAQLTGKGFIKHIVYEPGTGISRVFEISTLVSYHLNGQ